MVQVHYFKLTIRMPGQPKANQGVHRQKRFECILFRTLVVATDRWRDALIKSSTSFVSFFLSLMNVSNSSGQIAMRTDCEPDRREARQFLPRRHKHRACRSVRCIFVSFCKIWHHAIASMRSPGLLGFRIVQGLNSLATYQSKNNTAWKRWKFIAVGID